MFEAFGMSQRRSRPGAGHMADFGLNTRRRVMIPQALGANEFMQATWHETANVIVFSQWRDGVCVAATPVRVTDTVELTNLLVSTLGHAATAPPHEAPSVEANASGVRMTRRARATRWLVDRLVDRSGLSHARSKLDEIGARTKKSA